VGWWLVLYDIANYTTDGWKAFVVLTDLVSIVYSTNMHNKRNGVSFGPYGSVVNGTYKIIIFKN
jgi:hypothetical protein